MPFTYRGGVTTAGNGYIKEVTNGNGATYTFGDAVTGYNGIDVKFLGPTASDYMLWDESANQLAITGNLAAYNETVLYVATAPTSVTEGARNGAVNFTSRRDIAFTSAWDGNADIGLKILQYNYSVSTLYGRIEGFEVLARNRTGSCAQIHGGYITAENYNGAGAVGTIIGLEVHSKGNGVTTTDVKALRVMDESGSSTGTHYGIELTTGDGAFMRAYGIMIDCNAASGAGWTNAISFNGAITNVLDFENSDGTNGATLHADGITGSGAGVKIRIDVAGTPYYLIAYATASDT
jgi:hypothetical protein